MSRWRTVTAPHAAGPTEKYRRIGSSRPSLPSVARVTMAAAVNGLPSDPDWYIVLSVAGTRCSRSAKP